MAKKKPQVGPKRDPQKSEHPFQGNAYRVRVLEMYFWVDVYDKDGSLIGRFRQEHPVMMPEAQFPIDLCKKLRDATELKDGFHAIKQGDEGTKP